MSTTITTRVKSLSEQTNQQTQLILEIEGLDVKFGIGSIKNYARIGDPDLYINEEFDAYEDWFVGGLFTEANQKNIISWDGTSDSISQRLEIDRGGATSISAIQVSLLDSDEYATQLITPGVILEEILGRKASVYLGYYNTAFPQDYVLVFSGIIDMVEGGATVVLNIAHPEAKKNGECFVKQSSTLSSVFNYRSAELQSVLYQTRRDVVGSVTVTYTNTGTAGSEVVTVSGNNISIAIQSGVSKAKDIRNAIEKSIEALSLVTVEIQEDANGNSLAEELQYAMALTTLGSSGTIQLVNSNGFLLPSADGTFLTYVRIGDEVIQYTIKVGPPTNKFLSGVTREAFRLRDARSFAEPHDVGSEVDSFYRITGNAIDLALKMMLSGGDEYFATDIQIKNINEVESEGLVTNAIYFEAINIQDKYGLVIGDTVVIEGDSVSNDGAHVITGVFSNEFGSWVTVNNTLTTVINSTGVCSFKSKYNVWPDGLGMGGDQVDVPQFEYIKQTFSSSIFEYDFYLKETVKGKEFIDEKLLFPTGAFTLPRKGKISCGYSAPPLGNNELIKFDSTNTVSPQNNKITRSINKNFYNAITFKFNDAVVDDKFLSGEITINADSKNRIKVGNRILTIECPGLRPSESTSAQIRILASRLLDRYKFGAEKVTIGTFYGKSFNLDVGDIVLFGDETMDIPDTKTGQRGLSTRLMEIQNKTQSFKTGFNKLELVDTAYSIGAASFGIVSPASKVISGSTTTKIKITESYGLTAPLKEQSKWENFFGEKIVIRSEDFSYYEETTLIGFDTSGTNILSVTALPSAPLNDYIVEIPSYPLFPLPELNQLYKRMFVFTNPSVLITAVTSQTVFDVAQSSRFQAGQTILIRREDWSQVSAEVKVLSVSVSTITVEAGITFFPIVGMSVELIGFRDGGNPYRYI